MASIRKEILIDARPGDVWDALRDFGAVHERLARGFVTDTQLDGNERIVTFDDGTEAREHLVGVDDEARRLAYAIVESPRGIVHYNGSAQVLPVHRRAHGTRSRSDQAHTRVEPRAGSKLVAARWSAGIAE